MKHSKEYIIKRLTQLKPSLQRRYAVSELALFGSVARGQHADASDIDILVDFDKPIGMGFFKLANELEDEFETRVDVVSRKGIKPHYLPYVESSLIQI